MSYNNLPDANSGSEMPKCKEYKKADNSDLNNLLKLATRNKDSLGIRCSRCNGVFERFGYDSFQNHDCKVNHGTSFFDFIKRLCK
jgi:hypothetical protein